MSSYSVTSYRAGALAGILIRSNQAHRRPEARHIALRGRRLQASYVQRSKSKRICTHALIHSLTHGLVSTLQLPGTVAPFDGSSFCIETSDAGDFD